MNTIEHLHGNAYTTDADYNEFLGAQYERTIYDWTRRCWVRCTMQAPKTPNDRVPTVDTEAAIVDEPWDVEPSPTAIAVAASKAARVERDRVLLDQMIAHLTERGPMSATRLAIELEIGDKSRVLSLVRRNLHKFKFYGGQHAAWGIAGQVYKPVKLKLVTQTMIAIRDSILAHGPQSTLELAKRLKAHQTTIHNSITRHLNWFKVVEIRKPVGNVPATRIWGLVDTEGEVTD